ncbi:MAG: cbb3-type cytochrome c oxidase N-terminal domain-containing protein [Bacteroidota bacterium]
MPLRNILKAAVISLTWCLFPGLLPAQETIAQQVQPGSSYNLVTILMVFITIVLAFVIYGLGQVLITLGRQALDKTNSGKKTMPLTLMAICLMLLNTATAQETPVPPVTSLVSSYGGMNATAFWLLAGVMLLEAVAIVYMLFFIKRIQAELMPALQKVEKPGLKTWWQGLDKKLFTRAVAVEQEADILLDHDYDGIRELDNSLPPWWKYGFGITIIISIIYMLNFHVFGGKSPTEEYQQELAEAQIQKELYEANNADKIDENNLQMPAAAGLEAGKEIFSASCWACHGKLGEGGAGPNLTDDYWLHKGSLTDIYTSIKKGYPDKGMQSWAKNFSPKEIANIAGYITTLRGTNPAGAKAAQGDLFTGAATDSTSKADTTNAVVTLK